MEASAERLAQAGCAAAALRNFAVQGQAALLTLEGCQHQLVSWRAELCLSGWH